MAKKPALIILSFLFFVNVIAGLAAWELSKADSLEVDFFDVGQGDAIFIKTASGHQILIDAGPDSTILEKLGSKMPFWDRTIDLVVLTHPEKDHLAGLLEVLKKYQVENILWTGVIRDIAEFKEWERLIKEEKAEIKIAKAGLKIIFPSAKPSSSSSFIASRILDIPGGVPPAIEVLYPFDNLAGQGFKDSNNTSIVSKLVFGRVVFLFTGDISASVEKEIGGREDIDIRAEVLKVSHHGSIYSTSEEFLQKVLPQIAVIFAGQDNPYGHPAKEILARLKNQQVFVTAENSDVFCRTDSKTIDCRGSR